jgi:hypothetical protein
MITDGQPMRQNLSNLQYFLTCWFHEDWPLESRDPREIVQQFRSEESSEAVADVRHRGASRGCISLYVTQ